MTDLDLLAYDDAGDGAALVFIHGLTFSRRTWDPIVERLRSDFRCVAIDVPGHGESTGSAADPPQVGERLHRTLIEIGVEDPVVIGHSAGAVLATGYAATFATRGVVNVDQPMVIAPFAGFLQQLEKQLRGPDFESVFAPFEQSIGVAQLPEPERTRVAGTRRIDQATVLDHWTFPLSTPPEEAQAVVDSLLDAITVPYLYLTGDEQPAQVIEHLRAHLKNPEIVTWPGSGHVVHLAEPDRFAALVADFASRLH